MEGCQDSMVVHSPDFRNVKWYGQSFSFTPTQSNCIRILWENWKRGTPEVSQERILSGAGSNATRLIDLFRTHKTWRELVRPGLTRGLYRLNTPPENAGSQE